MLLLTDITNEHILNWTNQIKRDPTLPEYVWNNPVMLQLCLAGKWLTEQLHDLSCSPELIPRIQFAAGQSSFGRNPWQAHNEILQAYLNNSLIFEEEILT